MMVGGSTPLVQRDSNPSRTSRDRESMVRFAGDEEEGAGGAAGAIDHNRQSVVSEERDEAMDPFEDQRGGYYGYEDERGFGAQRGGCESFFSPVFVRSACETSSCLFLLRQSCASDKSVLSSGSTLPATLQPASTPPMYHDPPHSDPLSNSRCRQCAILLQSSRLFV